MASAACLPRTRSAIMRAFRGAIRANIELALLCMTERLLEYVRDRRRARSRLHCGGSAAGLFSLRERAFASIEREALGRALVSAFSVVQLGFSLGSDFSAVFGGRRRSGPSSRHR